MKKPLTLKPPLTFSWPDHRKVSFALPGFLLLSLLLHGATFTLFQVDYPRSGTVQPPPAGVTLLTPNSAENRALLKWVDASDPALTSKPQEVVPCGLLDLHYQPSYSELYTEPQPAPATPDVIGFPSMIEPQKLIGHAPSSNTRSSSPAPRPTQMRFSGELENRISKSTGAGKISQPFANKSSVTLEPAQFLVGVNSAGEVAYVFLQHSSLEPKIDREAEARVAQIRFSPAETMSWGMISFCWGCDLFSPSTRTSGLP